MFKKIMSWLKKDTVAKELQTADGYLLFVVKDGDAKVFSKCNDGAEKEIAGTLLSIFYGFLNHQIINAMILDLGEEKAKVIFKEFDNLLGVTSKQDVNVDNLSQVDEAVVLPSEAFNDRDFKHS